MGKKSIPYTGVDAIFNVNRFLPSKLRVESRVCSEGCTVVYLECDHSSGKIFHDFQWKEETSPIKQVEHGSMTYWIDFYFLYFYSETNQIKYGSDPDYWSQLPHTLSWDLEFRLKIQTKVSIKAAH